MIPTHREPIPLPASLVRAEVVARAERVAYLAPWIERDNFSFGVSREVFDALAEGAGEPLSGAPITAHRGKLRLHGIEVKISGGSSPLGLTLRIEA